MKIGIKTKNLELTPSIVDYSEDKLGSLAKFIQRFDAEGVAELALTIARTTAHHHKGEVFEAKADLRLPQSRLHASEKSGDIRVAIDKLKHTLHLEIEKYKTKLRPEKRLRGKAR